LTRAGAASAHTASSAPERASIRGARGVWYLPIADTVSSATAIHVAGACTGASTIRHVPIARAASPAVRCVSGAGAGTRATAGQIAASCRLLPGLVLPRIRLSILHGVAPRGATVFICHRSVGVRSATTVLRVVLPVAVSPVDPVPAVNSVAAVDVLPIAVVDEVVVVVDGDVVVATPSAVVAPATAPHRTHRDSHSK
jgi:hypothetical protein